MCSQQYLVRDFDYSSFALWNRFANFLSMKIKFNGLKTEAT